jgi:hypothetical protein
MFLSIYFKVYVLYEIVLMVCDDKIKHHLLKQL